MKLMSFWLPVIAIVTFVLCLALLYLDYRDTKDLQRVHSAEPVSEEWQVEYDEANEDRRHYTNLTWQLPSAIFVADGLAIGFAYSKDFRGGAPCWAPALLLIAACMFNVIMFLNFWKFGYRSYSRLQRIKKIEQEKGLRRIGGIEPIIVRWGSWRWMSLLIVGLSAILFELALSSLGI